VKLNRWVGELCGRLLFMMLVILVLVPSHYEIAFVKYLYHDNPALLVLTLVTFITLVIGTIWLIPRRRAENEQQRVEAFPEKKGML